MAAPLVNSTSGVTSSRPAVTTLSSTVLIVHDTANTVATDANLDVGFIIALVCFAIGGLLLLIGFIKVLVWYIDSRKHEKYSKWWLRQLEHRRHLEEYSIRTGDVASHYSASVHSLTNQGFTHEEEEDDFRSHDLSRSPVATATQSAEISDLAIQSSSYRVNGKSADSSVVVITSNGGGMHRQDKNMNEIMDYL